MNAMSSVIQEAGPLGVTVCVASGDGGSDDGQGDGVNLPDFPASSPYALGCGGTALVLNGTTIVSEVVWEDDPTNPDNGATGGGISSVFQRPAYQNTLVYPVPGKTGRMVPDVAGNADPNTGYNVIVDGQHFPVGGTSAVAPLMAAMICLLNEALGKKVGFVNPNFYAAAKGTFNQITSGNNGKYVANAAGGYNCCTGLGTVNFAKLVAALKS
jgi:kumamolisin